MYPSALKNNDKIFSVAPMMDWTDRHCRYFHRTLTKQALLYSEMVTADAKLAQATEIGASYGYDEVNLNVGCPSDRVQNGTFGACLMREPQLVAECVDAMKQAVSMPVSVKPERKPRCTAA